MDKLHAFFITLEYLNTCEFSFKAGPLKYLAELEEWRHENRGLALAPGGGLADQEESPSGELGSAEEV